MEEIAQVYARALFEVASEQDTLDQVHDELGTFADAMNANRELMTFFFSPYFSVADKKTDWPARSPAPARRSPTSCRR